MTKELLISSDPLEDRVALLENGRLAEIAIARGERMVGSIYKGKVMNVLPGMQAAFVDIGLERNAFLSLDDALPTSREDLEDEPRHSRHRTVSIEQVVKPHQERVVQLVKEPIAAKGGRITTNIALPGRYVVLLPLANEAGVSRRVENQEERNRLKGIAQKIKPKNMGLIIRTGAETKPESVLRRDLGELIRAWKEIYKKSETAKPPVLLHQDLGLTERVMRDMLMEDVQKCLVDSKSLFEKVLKYARDTSPALGRRVFYYEGKRSLFEHYRLDEEIAKLLRKKVWLPSGGYIVIEGTEALTVIDVNSGKYVGNRSLEETIFKINLEAAAEIARQIRLRDLSGIIIVDFIDMERRDNRRKLVSALEEHFKSDRVKAVVFGVTHLGLVEITRKRSGKNIDRTLREECFYCGGHGRLLSPESVSIQLERDVLSAAVQRHEKGLFIQAHPEVAVYLAGWRGERLDTLEKAVGKEIFLRADSSFHIENYRIQWDAPEIIRSGLQFVQEKVSLDVEVLQPHPLETQSGVAFVNGQMIEILNCGENIGEKVRVHITSSSRSYMVAEKDTVSPL